MIHQFLLFVLDENAFVDSEDEGGGEILAVVVVLREGVLWREGFSLKFGAELNFDVIFGRVGF